jgi:iron(III) transport system permease protein
VVLLLRGSEPGTLGRIVPRLTGIGYAIPGAVLALGLLWPLAAFDNWVSSVVERALGVRTGLLITGTTLILLLAYAIRFLAVAQSTIDAGYERLSPNVGAAARALGASRLAALIKVDMPLLIPTLGAAALLVFVDAMKELPATVLLRPFGFETLSTAIYAHAALEEPEKAAAGALVIVLAGLIPVILLQRAMRGGRAG